MNLKRKYVFVYFNRIELCSTPEQAIYFINSLINPRSAKQLKCSETAECRIYAIFFGEIVGNEAGTVDYFIYKTKKYSGLNMLQTTGTGSTHINYYPALADTLEEHNRLYQTQLEKINQERFEQNKELVNKRRQELSEIREGIYAVRYYFYLTVYTNERGTIKGIELYKGNFFAKSGYDAYEKMVEYLTNKYKYNPRVAHLRLPRAECGDFQFEYIKYHLDYAL